MSTSVTSRRKTLYELNNKIPDYKKKSIISDFQISKKPQQTDQKQLYQRRRFQSTNFQSEKQNLQSIHPIRRFINTKQSVSDQQLRKYSSFLYKGVKYSVNLKQPSLNYIEKRKISIHDVKLNGQNFDMNKKLLILDLDETLIHSVNQMQQSDVTLKIGKNCLKFNIRPYCYKFLQQMSSLYNIVVYTASTENYAHPIIEYLNKPYRTIKAILHRGHCLETHNGFHIKDLRIIKQFNLQSMIIVDNLVHSFAFQLDNGIPILQFLNNKKDRQLFYLAQKLANLTRFKDVTVELKKMYNLTQILQHRQNQFIWKAEERI